MAEESIGRLLQGARTFRGLSIVEVARRAGISERTIRRWEGDEHLPRSTELRAVLEVLGASSALQQRAFACVPTARGVADLQQLTVHPTLQAKWMPASGDLWRALRLRSGFTKAALAARVGVHATTVTRWEQSATTPSEAVRERLFAHLGPKPEVSVEPEVRVALLAPGMLFAGPLRETLTSFAMCEHYLDTLIADCGQGAVGLADLHFLTFEAHLWPIAGSPQVRQLLARAWAYHADYLLWRGHLAEMKSYATRALRTLHHAGDPHATLRAVICQAHMAAQRGPKPDAWNGYLTLGHWVDFAEIHTDTVGIKRDLAGFAAGAGSTERALDLLRQSKQEADRRNDAWALRAADHTEAGIHLRAGEPRKSVPLLHGDSDCP